MRLFRITFAGLFALTSLTLTAISQRAAADDMAAAKALQMQQDCTAIEKTLVQYTTGLDTLNADLYATAFTPNAKFYRGVDDNGKPILYKEGRDQIRTIITDLIESREQRAASRANDGEGGDPQASAPMMHHVMTNAVIEFIDDHTAHHYSYWMTVVGSGRDFRVAGMGRYDDTLTKQNGQWLINERNLMR